MNKKTVFLILFFIVIIGAGLRFYKLGERTFVGDEFFDLDAIYGYHMTSQWQPWDFNRGEIEVDNTITDEAKKLRNERSWAYRWPVVQVLRWLPLNEFTARSVSVVWGIVSIILIYFVAKNFTRLKAIGLLAAYLFAVNISAIELDRTLRMYSMLLPIFLLFAWFFYRFWEEEYRGNILFVKKIWERWRINLIWLLPALAAGLLSLHLNQLTVAIVPAFAAYALIQALLIYNEKKSYWNKYAISLFLLIIIFLIVIFSGILEKATTYTNTSVSTYVKFFRHNYNYISLIGDNYTFLPLIALIVFFGIFQSVKKLKLKKEVLWISCCYFVPLILAIYIWNYGAFDRFIFFIKSLEVILIALGIYFIAKYIAKRYFRERKAIFIGLVLVMTLLVPNCVYFFQKENLYNKIPPKDELNYRSIFKHIKENRSPDDVLITRNYRSYYFRGENIKVFNFGGEFNPKKFTLEDLEKITTSNPNGWIVIPERDEQFVKKDVIKYFKSKFSEINKEDIFGEGTVYYWGNNN